ncbi:pyrroline-5-carboxylate reductase [Woodsholea maritima]|uniref:pyrroline-5-carboxylate reductase n=1 Tax=Woodsholea maritima TaxID=240237 RepID=UPI000374AB34|nr:pyrroline-5-carboxylate reductase [Woodsholea maritima]
MAKFKGKLALIGVGRMGAALATSWLTAKRGKIKADQLVLVAPRRNGNVEALVEAHPGLTWVERITPDLGAELDSVIIAVKPHIVIEAVRGLSSVVHPRALIVSIAAGTPLRQLNLAFQNFAIVRAMPNTPISVGAGATSLIANEPAQNPDYVKRAEALFKSGGSVTWLEDERLMGVATALAGSGPAYVFLLTEAMANAGMAEGLSEEAAWSLAKQTVIGAAQLMALREEGPQELRREVTSPGGTTQAALDVLMGEGGLPTQIRNAMAAAERRSRQLGS